jgi:ribose 5-phosphate isomerase RpiB
VRKFRNTTRTTKMVVAAVIASIVFAGVYGFAASLGLTSSGLGAGSAVVAACGTGINAAYTTTYSSTIPGYSVSQVNLTAIPAACLSKRTGSS